jgi:hypothetical protein
MPLNFWTNSGSGSIDLRSSEIFVIESVPRFVSKTAVIRAGSSWEIAVPAHACSGKLLKASTIAAIINVLPDRTRNLVSTDAAERPRLSIAEIKWPG